HLLDLGKRGTRLPIQPEHAKTSRYVVAQHARQFPVRWKVSEEARMLPVRKTREYDSLEVRQNRIETFGSQGRFGGQRRLDRAGLGRRHYGILRNRGAIVGNAVDDLVANLPEFFMCHAEVISTIPRHRKLLHPSAPRSKHLRLVPAMSRCHGRKV